MRRAPLEGLPHKHCHYIWRATAPLDITGDVISFREPSGIVRAMAGSWIFQEAMLFITPHSFPRCSNSTVQVCEPMNPGMVLTPNMTPLPVRKRSTNGIRVIPTPAPPLALRIIAPLCYILVARLPLIAPL